MKRRWRLSAHVTAILRPDLQDVELQIGGIQRVGLTYRECEQFWRMWTATMKEHTTPPTERARIRTQHCHDIRGVE